MIGLRHIVAISFFATCTLHVPHALAVDLRISVVDATGRPASGIAVLVDALAMTPSGAADRPPVEIRQQNLRFLPAISTASAGTELLFTNEDAFDHHVIGTYEKAQFEFVMPGREGAAKLPRGRRGPMKVRLPDPGVMSLSCHLHASMHAHVVVTDLAFHGVTNENGEIAFTGVHAGTARVLTWHPLMLTKAEPMVVEAVAPVNQVSIRLNHMVRPTRR
jgi:plastocyanin